MTNGVAGYVLAGGESSRMQAIATDGVVHKALLEVGSGTMLQNAIDKVREACGDVAVLCGPAERHIELAPHVRAVPDRAPRCGPLGALDAALADALSLGKQWVLLVQVDTPFLPGEALRGFTEATLDSGAAVGCMHDGEESQPLPVMLRVEAARAVETAVAQRELKLMPLLRSVAGGNGPYIYRPASQANQHRWFLNVNTPDDLHEARSIANAKNQMQPDASE